MAIYIKLDNIEKVIIDPKGDRDIMINLAKSLYPGAEIRVATEDEIARLAH